MNKTHIILLIFILVSCTKDVKIDTNYNNKTVGIQPYNSISNSDAKLIASVIDSFYYIKTIILPQMQLSKKAFINVKSPRYRADSIIRFQHRHIPKNVDFVLGITNEDISVTKNDKNGNIREPKWKYCDFGVMGLAFKPGKSAIVSKFRVKSTNKKLEINRFKKVAVHEFGHNLGLDHCPNTKCVMTSAKEKLSTIDSEKMELCLVCKKKINYKN